MAQIKPEKEQRIKIQQEVKMLQYLRGGADIIELQDLVRDPKLNLKVPACLPGACARGCLVCVCGRGVVW